MSAKCDQQKTKHNRVEGLMPLLLCVGAIRENTLVALGAKFTLTYYQLDGTEMQTQYQLAAAIVREEKNRHWTVFSCYAPPARSNTVVRGCKRGCRRGHGHG